MQVYKTYFKILNKLKTSILIYAIMFIVLTYVFTINTSVGSDKYRASKVKTMIINEDGQSELVDGFLKYLDQYVTVVDPGKDDEAIKDALFFSQAEYILTIPKGFSESFLTNGTAKLNKETIPNSVAAMSLDTVIDNYFNLAKVYIKHVPSMDYTKLNTYITSNISDEAKAVFDVETKSDVSYSNEFNQFYYNFLGYVIIAAFITAVSMIMFSFNGVDIRRRHNASPISYRKFNLQLIAANMVFIVGYLLLFIIVGFVLNKSRIINLNFLLTILNALVFGITVLSVSYLIGITVNSRKAIGAMSTALSLGVSFMSGIFVPQQYLGSSVLRVASFTPAYWYVKANNSILNVTSFQWNQVSEAFGCMGVQIGFTIAFISIALVVSKRKRQQTF